MTSIPNNSSDSVFLDQIVEQFALTTPTKTALIFEQTRLNYRQLMDNVYELANNLLQQGIKPGQIVATLFEPGSEVTIALLAITRIGAIYAPLDPEHPLPQLQERIRTLTPSLVLHQESQHATAARLASLARVFQSQANPISQTNDPVARSLLAPACIFFTSGTTGQPKGVVGSALALRESIVQPARHLRFNANDTLNSMARYAWSISMLELLAPLVNGGTSLILNRKKALNIEWLTEQIRSCTTFHCPPALLKTVAEHILNHRVDTHNIRLAWYGGDSFTPKAIQSVQQAFPNATIGTAYGCTEIFGLSHIHLYPQGETLPKVLIGQPVPGMLQHIEMETAEGQSTNIGEVWLGGDRVMLGYWQKGSINAEHLIHLDNAPYYQTGDFVRLYPPATLEFLERRDSQVKIRGIRVELGEIDAAITTLPGTIDAITLAVDSEGEKYLRSFVVAPTVAAEELRHQLKTLLPDYMLPSYIQVVDALPTTENFKVDRKALLQLPLPAASTPTSASLTPQMETIARLWQKYARVKATSPDDHFFDLGGNSMSAAVLASALTRETQCKFDVADLYSLPTLGQLASKLQRGTPAAKYNHLALADYPASYGQAGLFFRELFSSTKASITCTRYFKRQDGFNLDTVKATLMQLLQRHPTLRTPVAITNGKLRMQELPIESLDENKIKVERLLQAISCTPNSTDLADKLSCKFDIKGGDYLIQAFIRPLLEGGELLQLTAHHIAADDNAMGRLGREFCTIYQALTQQRAIELPESAKNYGEFATEQTESNAEISRKASAIATRLLNHLQGPTALTPEHGELKSQQVLLPKKDISFAEFMASISWAMTATNQVKEFVFCLHVALKRDSDDCPQVGMFINLVPVFCRCDRQSSPQMHLENSIKSLDAAIANSNVPYELILSAEPQLKKQRRFPFDVYLNELRFQSEQMESFENIVIPRSFATDSNELSFTLVFTDKKTFAQADAPSEKISDSMINEMRDFLAAM